jgi:hypothetical protein
MLASTKSRVQRAERPAAAAAGVGPRAAANGPPASGSRPRRLRHPVELAVSLHQVEMVRLCRLTIDEEGQGHDLSSLRASLPRPHCASPLEARSWPHLTGVVVDVKRGH